MEFIVTNLRGAEMFFAAILKVKNWAYLWTHQEPVATNH